MRTAFVEATQSKAGGFNHGKFAVCAFDEEERRRPSQLDLAAGAGWRSLVARCGLTRGHVWVLDLQTAEGACFRPGGSATADLDKHKVWVCPMFGPFLQWLYQQPLEDVLSLRLPELVELPDAEAMLAGYRRQGT